MNEMLLILQLLVFYGTVVLTYWMFGTKGLLVWTAIATIAANIEVLIQVEAFGMSMTLGNILFASTFIVTDILSEVSGKREANRAVYLGIFTSVAFIVISQSWMMFNPSSTDFVMPAIRTIFSNTPRLMLTSLVVYAVVQRLDVWLYHAIWGLTTKWFGDSRKGLYIRNNGATLIAQFFNNVLFTFGAFYGIIPTDTLWSMVFASYVIFIVTSLADTPVVYICRKLKEKGAVLCE